MKKKSSMTDIVKSFGNHIQVGFLMSTYSLPFFEKYISKLDSLFSNHSANPSV